MAAKVGIFWVYQGEIIAVPVEREAGEDDGLFINGPQGHAEAWEALRRRDPHLRYLEYEQVPRGRVLFDKRQRRYLVYLDRVLLKARVKAQVRAAFGLPRAVFCTDEHYTTSEDDLARLLGAD
jgi:hypothetical protein